MKLQYTKSDINYYFVCLVILTYWMNFEVLLFLRFTDVIILFYIPVFFLTKQFRKRRVNIFLILFVISLFISSIIGLFVTDMTVSNNGLAFVYKYGLLFLFLWMISSMEFSKEKTDALIRYLFYSFAFLVLYVVLRAGLIVTGRISAAGGMRPDFPLTFHKEGEWGNAGHLFGAYLANGLVCVFLYWKVTSRKILFGILLLLTAIAVILTGSRGPLLALFLSALTYSMKIFNEKIKSLDATRIKKFTIKIFLFIIIILAVLIILFLSFNDLFGNFASKVIVRAFNFRFTGSDDSFSSRIWKTSLGFENLEKSYYLFGTGPFTFPGWFDNSLIRILNDAGFIGFFILIAWITYTLRKQYFNELAYFLILTFVFNNLSAEFFLVTRFMVPGILGIALLMKENSYAENLYHYRRSERIPNDIQMRREHPQPIG